MTRFEGDWVGDPYAPSSRFTRGATIALPVGEELDIALSRAGHDQAARRREAVRAEIGDWILVGQPDLGKPERMTPQWARELRCGQWSWSGPDKE
jgi:hypothetical protein